MNKYIRFTLNHFLSDYPQWIDFNEILTLIENYDDSIVVWEPFAAYDPEKIIELILDFKENLEQNFIPKD